MLPPTTYLSSPRTGRGYLIEEMLDRGGQGAVYLARDAATQERVVIKEMSRGDGRPETWRRAERALAREWRLLRSLTHPGLARAHDLFYSAALGKPCLVLEHVPGRDLEQERLHGGAVAWPQLALWGMALCDVLAYLHGQRPPIVHRDVKPANVILTPHGQLKLIDLGLAWYAVADAIDDVRPGTPGYAAPEVYAGRPNPPSDIYGLGATLYHLVIGSPPDDAAIRMAQEIDGLMIASALRSALRAPVTAASHDGARVFIAAVARALELQPTRRWPNAQEFGGALRDAARMGYATGAR
jgi:serine/threonine-protein kinase